jgi:predicted CXXCH cytochrome family protein
MNKPSRIIHTCASVLALTLLLSGCSPAPTPTATPGPSLAATATSSAPSASNGGTAASSSATPQSSASTNASSATVFSQDLCLGCHGPYEKLASATADYTMPSGEKTNPHLYVPHNSKNIPECSNCHESHPVPLTTKEGLRKPNAEWCYTCHHTRTFVCGTCHD